MSNAGPVAVLGSTCSTAAPRGGRDVASHDAYELVLVRSGCFSYRDARGAVLADAATALLGPPGQLGETAHPGGGDVTTQVLVHPELWHAVAGEGREVPLHARITPAMQWLPPEAVGPLPGSGLFRF